jgi:hypothetical protein
MLYKGVKVSYMSVPFVSYAFLKYYTAESKNSSNFIKSCFESFDCGFEHL